MRCITIDPAFCPGYFKESPKSPLNALPRNTPYWTTSGLSNPQRTLIRSICSRVASSGRNVSRGSPDTRVRAKTTTVTTHTATNACTVRSIRYLCIAYSIAPNDGLVALTAGNTGAETSDFVLKPQGQSLTSQKWTTPKQFLTVPQTKKVQHKLFERKILTIVGARATGR